VAEPLFNLKNPCATTPTTFKEGEKSSKPRYRIILLIIQAAFLISRVADFHIIVFE
jgi:hypothetical protein